MISYVWKVRLLKRPRFNLFWRYWNVWRGKKVGNYSEIPTLIRQYAKGHTFADIGCMWGVNGEYAFLAEEAGATAVKGVDVFGPTPEFEAKKRERNSSVEFVLGDIGTQATLTEVGSIEVVFCAGVLYHHPSPFDLLVALRKVCSKTLILRTSTIPEVKGLPNAAVYFPMLSAEQRKLWNLSSLGLLNQVGITNGFEPEEGYGNWFWGLTPSCLESLLITAGFKVEQRFTEPFAQTVICSVIAPPFVHELPNELDAKRSAEAISSLGIAKPA
ncbi:DUF1698 domain-containing protein [Hymenobacter wooponensis]|uniref:DUF1698 domain-containing protein n=1 Tax=Hymenobacter wooponensis TaxID=1525360 RepID=A0A4Z0MNC3_9BACT|nr:DUF1698 domain-containing protein [Hymenobacter wooponensis]TGD81402.1 DUF1698 domain-containing protein [Hymenobacter wooponensis]